MFGARAAVMKKYSDLALEVVSENCLLKRQSCKTQK